MEFFEIFAIALALAVDACVVAIAAGAHLRCSPAQTLRMASAFGGFQFLMPVIGWALGLSVHSYIKNFGHWIAFALLVFVGGKMLYEVWRGGDKNNHADPTRGITLILLAVATSIDALAVGVSMAMIKISIWYPAAVIGLVCFVATALGMHAGRLVIGGNKTLGNKANAVGGLVLIGIGIKILVERGVFG